MKELLATLVRTARRFVGYGPSRIVLRTTGESARILGVRSPADPDDRARLVEKASGEIRHVRPGELVGESPALVEAVLLQLALVLASSVATLATPGGR